MFIYRSANGVGTATVTNIKAGITSYGGTFEIRGFAIEMVYIPQGSFWVGDGSTTAPSSSQYYKDSATNAPFQITGLGNTIQIGSATGKLFDPLLSQPFSGNLGNFPTGYNAYWMMKYELSAGAYRDFLNTLTYIQQLTRMPSGVIPNMAIGTCITCSVISTSRTSIEIKTPGNSTTLIPAVFACDNYYSGNNIFDETTDGEWCSVSSINWTDAAAYLDWAGLRPMTELEYEKACRGPLVAVANEFAWGNDQIATQPYNLINAGMVNESITNATALSGNASYQTTSAFSFPANFGAKNIRGGIFATTISDRVSAGAGFYGAMELTGNLEEFTVGTNSAAGRSYTGKNGNGSLNVNGEADENRWPGINGNSGLDTANTNYAGTTGVTNNAGMSSRGGSWGVTIFVCYMSRRNTQVVFNFGKSESFGIRGVRDAN
jgi:hypothetical protein